MYFSGSSLKLVAALQDIQGNPRGLIYSTLGLLQVYSENEQPLDMLQHLFIDYGASIDAVYSSFVMAVVENSKRLKIFAFCTSDSPNVNKSLVPDWTQVSLKVEWTLLARKMAHLVEGFYGYHGRPEDDVEGLWFDACPGTFASVSFSNDASTMLVSGFILDTISAPMQVLGWPYDEATQTTHREFLQSLLPPLENNSFFRVGRQFLACLLCNVNFDEQSLESYRRWIEFDVMESLSGNDVEIEPDSAALAFDLARIHYFNHGDTILHSGRLPRTAIL
jgi:hypothetical protein